MYETHLSSEGIEHSDELFSQFVEEHDQGVCNVSCDSLIYIEGTVQCSSETS